MREVMGGNSTVQILSAAATIAALGFLTVAPPVQADPIASVPLAPACDQFVFNGRFEARGTPLDHERSGWKVFFDATGQSAGTPPAAVVFNDGGEVKGVSSPAASRVAASTSGSSGTTSRTTSGASGAP